MALQSLKYLGLSSEDIIALREAVKAQHNPTGMQTAMGCVCGRGGGGPAGSAACKAFEALCYAGQQALLERPPRRDPSVCNHQFQGKLRLWEYEGKTLCEICSAEVM